MPAKDGTGPMGMGPGTGRGRGGGGGRGRCHRGGWDSAGSGPGSCSGELTREQEVEQLKQQAEHFKKAHEDICERIRALEAAQNE